MTFVLLISERQMEWQTAMELRRMVHLLDGPSLSQHSPGSAGTQQSGNSFSFPCFLPLLPLKDKSEPLHSPLQNHKEISDQWEEKGKLDQETSPS